MATIKIHLDSRRARRDGTFPLVFAVSHLKQTRFISLDINFPLSVWDSVSNSVKRSAPIQYQRIYSTLADKRLMLMEAMLSMDLSEYDVTSLRDALAQILGTAKTERVAKRCRRVAWSLDDAFNELLALKRGKTHEQYVCCRRQVERFVGGDLSALRFEDVTLSWLRRFDLFMVDNGLAHNTRADYMICLRAVFNFALDEEKTSCYPFRRFRIRKIHTRKRALSLDEIRRLWSVEVEDWQQQYVDFWKLTFLLIGINSVDLLKLTRENVVGGDRIEFNRSKTMRLYSVKIEPEARVLLEKYAGRKYLLSALDRYKDYSDYRRRVNDGLQRIGTGSRKGRKGDAAALFPGLTTYWARHSWATIAASLDIPKETIAAALGHGGNSVTDIYIDFDRRKIDEANRRVIDWVLYEKNEELRL